MKNDNWYLKTNENNFVPATAENIVSFICGDGKPKKSNTDIENREREARYLKMGILVKCYYEDGHNVTEFI